MASRRSGRHLKTFLEPVASVSQSISPWRSMATPFTPKTTQHFDLFRTCTSHTTHFPKLDLNSSPHSPPSNFLDPSQRVHIECLHLLRGGMSAQSLISDRFESVKNIRFGSTMLPGSSVVLQQKTSLLLQQKTSLLLQQKTSQLGTKC